MVSITEVNQKVEITYPVKWSYKLVGRDADAIKEGIMPLLNNKEHTIKHSNQSKTGKFVSIACEMLIMHEEERLYFYEEFKKQETILYVL